MVSVFDVMDDVLHNVLLIKLKECFGVLNRHFSPKFFCDGII